MPRKCEGLHQQACAVCEPDGPWGCGGGWNRPEVRDQNNTSHTKNCWLDAEAVYLKYVLFARYIPNVGEMTETNQNRKWKLQTAFAVLLVQLPALPRDHSEKSPRSAVKEAHKNTTYKPEDHAFLAAAF